MNIASAPVRPVKLAVSGVEARPGRDGVMYLRSTVPLGPYPRRMTDRLDEWASRAPDRTFLAQRRVGGEWRRLSYAEARTSARRIAQALVDRRLSRDRPIAILSGNDIEHALLALGAMYAGVPYAPVSTAYSLISQDFGKLRHVLSLVDPALVFAADGRFERALAAAVGANVEVVMTTDLRPGATDFATLLNAAPSASLEAATAAVDADTVFKILFTSGSTSTPKGAMQTHRMWCSNQEMIRTCLAFVADEPPVIIDWLPWNHTFAGNKNFGLVLYNGGTLYLDAGRPVPGHFEESLRNLREIAPTIYLNVPKGFDALVPYLREDSALRELFFSRLRILFYAGAGLSQRTWDDLATLSIETVGARVPMVTGLGATETAPWALWAGAQATRAGILGVPAPGVELKLAPVGHKLEARVKGPSITPGYWRQPDLTAAAFDEEGFYRFGDALRFVDRAHPELGLVFDGRIAEDFKLSSGTWVSVGPLRNAFLAHVAPLAIDVVIAGHDRAEVGVLVFPDVAACRALAGPSAAAMGAAELLHTPAVREAFRSRLETLAAASTGGSTRIARLLLLDEPPSIDAHEMTDKGTINQRAVLERRSANVDDLFSSAAAVITLE